eukprot:s1311_g13.t1
MKNLEAWWSPSQMISKGFLIGTVSAVINCTSSPIIIPILLFTTLRVALARKDDTDRFKQAWPGQTRLGIGIFMLRHAAPLVSQDAWNFLLTYLHQYALLHFFTAKHLTSHDDKGSTNNLLCA